MLDTLYALWECKQTGDKELIEGATATLKAAVKWRDTEVCATGAGLLTLLAAGCVAWDLLMSGSW